MREKILITNWKMNADYVSISKFFKNIPNFENVKVMVAPSYLGIIPSLGMSKNSNIEVISQNVSLPSLGNHTGSVSWLELKDYGIKTTFIGHPDVKLDFKEKNYQVNTKLEKLLKNGMNAIVFIEETKVDLSKESTKENLRLQINQIFNGLEGLDIINKVYLVYKPTFMGEINSKFDNEFIFGTVRIIRDFLRTKFGYYVANNIPIIYGGEIVNDDIEEICKSNDVDGVLIEDERALSNKYVSILYKHLFNGSTYAYKQYYDHKITLDIPTEDERIKNATKVSDFDMYDATSETYFDEIKIIEEDI